MKLLLSILSVVSGNKFALILISIVLVVTVIDSQFIRIFYGTDLGSPGDVQLLIFA